MPKLPFSLEEAQKTNILVSGANSSGKTYLSCFFASQFLKQGCTVICLDISGVWKHISDIPLYVQVEKVDNQIKIPSISPEQSVIYDLSTLRLSESKQVIDSLSLKIWDDRIKKPNPKQTFVFCEESEGMLKTIRSKDAENLFRLIHVGRNINVRCTLITTDLALIDASVIRLCSLRFLGRLCIEENSRRKVRSMLGKEWAKLAYEALETGMFIFYDQSNRKQPLQIKVFEEYKPTVKARRYYEPIRHTIKKDQPTIKGAFESDKPSFWSTFKALMFAPFALIDGGISTDMTKFNNIRHSNTFDLFNKEEDNDNDLEEMDLIILDC